MSDNSSFLRLLGFEDEGSAARKLPEASEPSNSGSASATEWDIGAENDILVQASIDENFLPDVHESTEELRRSQISENHSEEAQTFEGQEDAAVPDEFPENFVSSVEDSTQHEIESEEFSNISTHSSKTEITTKEDQVHIEGFLTKTEVLDSQLHLQDFEPLQARDKTFIYTAEEAEAFSEPKTVTLHPSEDSAVLLTQSLVTGPVERSRVTMPFEYDEAGSASGKTAHFDYSEEGGASRVVVLEGRANAKAVHLNQLPLRMGRDTANELVLDDENASRFHAELRDFEGAVGIVDLGSTNGVKVNGLLVTEQILKAHDVIQIGDCLIEFLPSGVLSKGAPKVGAFQVDHSGIDKHSKRRMVFLVSFISILALSFILFGKRGQIEEAAKNLPMKIAADQAQKEIESIRSGIEGQLQKKFTEATPNDLKKMFLSKLESSQVGALIPMALRANLEKIPAIGFRLLLEDPKMISDIVARGANEQALNYVLRERLNNLIEQKRYADALTLAEFLFSTAPQDESLKQAVVKLKELAKVGSADAGDAGGRAYADLSEDEKKFYEYMDLYDRNHEELMGQKRYSQALTFAKLVREKLGEVSKTITSLDRVVRPEIEHWDTRIAQIERKVANEEKKKEVDQSQNLKGDSVLKSIKLHMDLGEVGAAKKEIEFFLNNYSDHPKLGEVSALKHELESGLEKTFVTTRSTVERFVKTESYENAWKELYRFLDVMPAHAQALALRESIDKLTQPKAAQFYNQARVYEFEADDLVAAEQYYKRAIDVADPRSELAKKAGRRYEEVKRKTIR